MKLKFWLAAAGVLLALGLGLWLGNRRQDSLSPAEEATGPVFYYSETCPHCLKVEEWLDKNKEREEKFGLVRKNVTNSQENARELARRTQECYPRQTTLTVPFLYDQGQCMMGDQEIIAYLEGRN